VRLWRISKSTWQDSIWSGIGGLHADGRWHQRGAGTIVYTSDSLALAAWEIFVNLAKPLNDPPALVSAYADVPDSVPISHIEIADLPPNWNHYPRPEELKKYGTNWREKGQTLLLRVPSAVISGTWNFLINPEHPDWQLTEMSDPVPFHFDVRTFLPTP
jgi:RES domain-containing protein